ncbi:MAG: SAM-dependent methyltransferase [Opitutaceae bacterium]
MTNPLIHDVSDTAKWVAVFRADESDRADAIFVDPFARRLAGPQGKAIAEAIEFTRKNSWAFVARTYLFDEFIKNFVNRDHGLVVNLAAGLDTRPYRLDLSSSLQWVEIDLPEILNYKESILSSEKPRCQLRRFGFDLKDRTKRTALFEQLGTESKNVLVVTEGLLGYLDETEVAALAADLAHQPSFRHWILDLMSPGLFARVNQEMGAKLRAGNAPLKFAPVAGEGFFRQYGWGHLESKSKFKTAAQLNRLSPEMMAFAEHPEPVGPKGDFPWSGVCVFENARPLG